MCAMMAKGQKEEDGTETGTIGGVLSVEAVTAHAGLGMLNSFKKLLSSWRWMVMI